MSGGGGLAENMSKLPCTSPGYKHLDCFSPCLIPWPVMTTEANEAKTLVLILLLVLPLLLLLLLLLVQMCLAL